MNTDIKINNNIDKAIFTFLFIENFIILL